MLNIQVAKAWQDTNKSEQPMPFTRTIKWDTYAKQAGQRAGPGIQFRTTLMSSRQQMSSLECCSLCKANVPFLDCELVPQMLLLGKQQTCCNCMGKNDAEADQKEDQQCLTCMMMNLTFR